MNYQSPEQVTRWRSKNKTISLSTYHKDMYIITHEDNGWHNIHSTQSEMLRKYPPNKNETVVKRHVPLNRIF